MVGSAYLPEWEKSILFVEEAVYRSIMNVDVLTSVF
jgi:muramoyltetrapeptide carboxypeptidase LdcA involved in peptidoglycan recycling